MGTRLGDAASMAFIELVDFDENMAKTVKAEKKTRRSRGGKKVAEVATEEVATEEVATEEVATEAPAETEAPKAE